MNIGTYKRTPEQRAKMREAQLSYYAEHPGHNTGRKFRESWRKNIGLASKGRTGNIGKVFSDERRQQMSETMLAYFQTHTHWNKGKKGLGAGVKRSEEFKAKLAQRKREWWAKQSAETIKRRVTPGLVAMHKSRFAENWTSGNGLEQKVDAILQRLYPKKFVLNLARKQIGNKVPDFISHPPDKLLIEVFGDHWHGQKLTGRTRTAEERRKIGYFAQYGYTTVVFWESELDDERWIKAKIDLALAR